MYFNFCVFTANLKTNIFGQNGALNMFTFIIAELLNSVRNEHKIFIGYDALSIAKYFLSF
jgi:hypothetical protein